MIHAWFLYIRFIYDVLLYIYIFVCAYFMSCIPIFLYVLFCILQYRMLFISNDDAIKWKHFPRNWPFVRGIHRSPVISPHKGQWRGALVFSLICFWINGWVNNREAGDLRRYRAHYDVTVMPQRYFTGNGTWLPQYRGSDPHEFRQISLMNPWYMIVKLEENKYKPVCIFYEA